MDQKITRFLSSTLEKKENKKQVKIKNNSTQECNQFYFLGYTLITKELLE